MENYIPLEKCKDGYLYIIAARNAPLGIFKQENNSFVISRWKFGRNYLFEEYHYDTGPPFGTAKPLEEVSRVYYGTEVSLLDFLNRHPLYREAKEKGIRVMFEDVGVDLTDDKLKLLMKHEY